MLSVPLLPLMYYQGKKIIGSVPKLPEAEGLVGTHTFDTENPKALSLLTIGESTIAGVGVKTHEEGFTGTLAKELSKLLKVNIDWKVYARSGYTADRVTKKIIPKIEEDKTDLIVIGLGANDAFALNSPNKWRKNIQDLIESLRTKFPDAPIVFCNMPPIKEFPAFTSLIKFTVGNLVEMLGQEVADLAEEYENVFYFGEVISIEKWMKKHNVEGQASDFFSDGVHPSKLTYQTWAKDIAVNISENDGLRDGLKVN